MLLLLLLRQTESIGRKLSNFNFQWTKILYHNYLKRIASFFLHFSGAMDVISYLLTPNTISYARENEFQTTRTQLL